jgi:spore cortex protein
LVKKQWLLPVAAVMSFGLTGCGNDESAQDRYTDSAQPIGYYSNENHKGGNARLLNDNDGPLIEMMDHSVGDEDRDNRAQKARVLQDRDKNGAPKNPTTPLANRDKNFFERDNRFSETDVNYHGHLNNRANVAQTEDRNQDSSDQDKRAKSVKNTGNLTNIANMTKSPQYNSDLSTRVANTAARVENVDDVRSVVYGNNVLIAVDLNNNGNKENTIAAIRKEVKPLLTGRSVRIVVDESTLSRISGMDTELSGGNIGADINTDLRNMFRDFDATTNN